MTIRRTATTITIALLAVLCPVGMPGWQRPAFAARDLLESQTDATGPVQVAPGSTWLQVSTGERHTCGIRTDTTLWCWGDDTYGQLGVDPDDLARDDREDTPVQVGEPGWRQVSAGASHTCAVRTDGSLWCWGRNTSGELGDATPGIRFTPVRVWASADWYQVAAGSWFTCAIRADATIWCWGSNYYGALGDSSLNTHTWSAVAAGYSQACAIRTDGTAWCWGADLNGSVSGGPPPCCIPDKYAPRLPPTRYGTLTGVTAIAAGYRQTCAVARGDLTCWGYGSVANLSVGMSFFWSQVVAGDSYRCGIRADATLWCGGSNGEGQLGQPPGGVASEVRVPGAWALIDGRWRHACAIRVDATLWCWGDDGTSGRGTSPTVGL